MKKIKLTLMMIIISLSQCMSIMTSMGESQNASNNAKMTPIDGCSFFTPLEISKLSTITLDKADYPAGITDKNQCQYTGSAKGQVSMYYIKYSTSETEQGIKEGINNTMRAVTKAQKDLKDGGVIKEASAREVTGIGLGAFVSAQRGNQDFINIELQTSTLEFSLSVKIILMPGDKKGIPFWEDKATSIGKALVEKINNKNYKLKE